MSNTHATTISWKTILPASLLVAGNLLGVGILAMPIKIGLSGYAPALVDIILISAIMLLSAIVIAYRIPAHQSHFDLPSFFEKELGTFYRYLAIICNLILLYGVLIVYLSAISTILYQLLPYHIARPWLTILYFLFATALLLSKPDIIKRNNVVLLILILIGFVVLITTGSRLFNPRLLTYSNWALLPIGLPVAVSTFHFHNVIPTVKRLVNHDMKATSITIALGVFIGFIINVTWVTIVLGSLPPHGPDANNLFYAFIHAQPATLPMTYLLNSRTFAITGVLFAGLALTASYVANGIGLFGFISDLTYHHLHSKNKWLVLTLSFLPPLIITLIDPHLFLSAIDIVGGIGETILFIILPMFILIKLFSNKSQLITSIAYIILTIGFIIVGYIFLTKLGLIHLQIK